MVDNNTKNRKLNIITMLQLVVPINIIFVRISLSCAIYVLFTINGIMIDMLQLTYVYRSVFAHCTKKYH